MALIDQVPDAPIGLSAVTARLKGKPDAPSPESAAYMGDVEALIQRLRNGIYESDTLLGIDIVQLGRMVWEDFPPDFKSRREGEFDIVEAREAAVRAMQRVGLNKAEAEQLIEKRGAPLKEKTRKREEAQKEGGIGKMGGLC